MKPALTRLRFITGSSCGSGEQPRRLSRSVRSRADPSPYPPLSPSSLGGAKEGGEVRLEGIWNPWRFGVWFLAGGRSGLSSHSLLEEKERGEAEEERRSRGPADMHEGRTETERRSRATWFDSEHARSTVRIFRLLNHFYFSNFNTICWNSQKSYKRLCYSHS